jgi:hypothetical protein
MLLAQCLGLAVACAKGEQLDSGPVQRITLPNPDASVPHDSGNQGSGGRQGSGGSIVMGSGGAPLGSGGSSNGGSSPGKGGSGGASAGGAVSSGGAKATGGAVATGGTSSGGAVASGGSASGGRASGGASGGGGKATGGSVGAGGGSGGAQNCKGYVDDDPCSQCICKSCKTDVELCFASGDATKDSQCKAIQECAETNHCASDPCYCVPTLANGFCANPDGPCVAPIKVVSGNASATQVQMMGADSTNPIGRANNVGKCTQTNCRSQCQLP